MSALTEFLTEMSFLRDGFAERARDVQAFMRSPGTRFILVSSADSVGLEAARSVAAEVRSRGFALDHAVFNRGFLEGLGSLDGDPPDYPDRLEPLGDKLRAIRIVVADEQRRKAENMARLRDELDALGWALPESTRPLADPSALSEWLARGRPVE